MAEHLSELERLAEAERVRRYVERDLALVEDDGGRITTSNGTWEAFDRDGAIVVNEAYGLAECARLYVEARGLGCEEGGAQ